MNYCPLCKALKNEKDKFLYEDKQLVFLPTKTKKGHKKRIMMVMKDHREEPYDDIYKDLFIQDFIEFCKEYFDDEPTFVLCESTYSSIPDHWHLIACDWLSDDEKEMKQLFYTPHRAIATNVEWEP